jgi:tRNA A37 threonylcarbamoyladenosine synthetase subunit TsaC/SUA5/YrdC
MCRDLSEIATYARVDNSQYRLLKATTPGSYTFILEGTRNCRGACCIPSARPSACACPNHPMALALLEELDEPC